MSQLVLACGIITVMIGAVVALGRALLWVWAMLRKVGRLADDLTGEPARPGFPASPGVLERLTGIEDAVLPLPPRLEALEVRIAAIEAQMRPNGGSTLRDAVDRIEAGEAARPA